MWYRASLIVLGFYSLLIQAQSDVCNRNQYLCAGSTTEDGCLFVKRLCNGRQDCYHGDDEDVDTCREFCGTLNNRVFCEYNRRCIRPHHDCEDVCPTKKYKCEGVSAPDGCIPMGQLCDGEEQCPGGEDEDMGVCENFCTTSVGRYFCQHNRKCIKLNQMCDGKRQCRGCEDEDPEHCQAVDCSGKFTRCGENADQCINRKHICDNTTHCVNGWDEEPARCPDTNIVTSPLPTRSQACYNDDSGGEEDEYASCSEEIPYYDYSHYHADVFPVPELFDQRLCERALFAHNWLRSHHVDMPPMTYLPSLAASAEDHAMYLGDRFMNQEFGGHTTLDVGENIFFGFAEPTADMHYVYPMENITYTWYDEGPQCQYNFDTGEVSYDGCEVTHFRQIVSRHFTNVGCGGSIATYFGQQFLHVVCQYTPTQSEDSVSPLREGVAFPNSDTYQLYQPYEP